jgi:hypothetical protein
MDAIKMRGRGEVGQQWKERKNKHKGRQSVTWGDIKEERK